MPVSIYDIQQAASRYYPVAHSAREARSLGLQTVFICHSHHDERLVRGVAALLIEAGWRVYIDWADTSMPATPSRETAQRIKHRIIDYNFFLFVATANSMSSRWCPWEIGYADGKKNIDQILILPTSDRGTMHGSEYLDLYRRIDLSDQNQLAVWQPRDSKNGILLKDLVNPIY